mmetsp:Transcript_54002/g.62076  ORF Transcript_54002/g.62076 Transcript_54002/m.62076 type:complete len:241 (+) Transcript_54002:58-780(+)|eukprot:CAMPEP_0176442514 /NCGR_PEP_ID=MMETSP0127-20121128/21861_1 /TAXON_ID=938130 /ORGANISM="Platyophrya macrostoma, Strain WH" /LENGTH=240 /DNA_ID=CAMNT_0017827543 /DNA_START=54 /DNA_END=776 /DNA_ORIENTATION=+
MLKRTTPTSFSSFLVNPETSSAPHGPPRGLVNRYISLGLPPWAAWCNKVNKYSLYRMSDASPRGFLPKAPQEMDVIWLNERVRERVRTSRNVNNVYRQLKYPHVKTGIHFSDTLDHWVQIPMVEAAMFEIEKDGGFDNFILSRSGMELKSKYGERIRRHILVRQKEIKKNFVLEKQAGFLASHMIDELKTASSKEEVEDVFAQYGVERKRFLSELARRVFQREKEAAPADAPTSSASAAV